MRRFFGSIGSVSRVTIESQALESNLLGDPSRRVVDVYIPAGHDGKGLPLLVDLVGFTGSGLSHTNWVGFRENLPERLDRLIGEQRMPPAVVAFPDCFTRLGGNQYINSAAMGAWEDYLLNEMLPAIEQRFGCGGSGRRGVFGIAHRYEEFPDNHSGVDYRMGESLPFLAQALSSDSVESGREVD
jgi:enterochelin esterase-like enzyme